MEEIWKPIKEYEELYQVSNKGRVKSFISAFNLTGRKVVEKILKPLPARGGYLRVTLTHYDGTRHSIFIHRLVALAFIPYHKGLPQVNHKDGDKHNNNADNLEWVTQSENMKHAYRLGLEKPIDYGFRKGIKAISADTHKEVGTFVSIREMCRQLKLDRRSVL